MRKIFITVACLALLSNSAFAEAAVETSASTFLNALSEPLVSTDEPSNETVDVLEGFLLIAFNRGRAHSDPLMAAKSFWALEAPLPPDTDELTLKLFVVNDEVIVDIIETNMDGLRTEGEWTRVVLSRTENREWLATRAGIRFKCFHGENAGNWQERLCPWPPEE